ncbi:MAG TPA: hypothetical protein PLI62_08890, partial [Spirochaetota bacterium]|nr:hypothetical protein [Spirochaetota bacterium]
MDIILNILAVLNRRVNEKLHENNSRYVSPCPNSLPAELLMEAEILSAIMIKSLSIPNTINVKQNTNIGPRA